MTTRNEIKSNNPEVRLILRSQSQSRQIVDVSVVKPAALAAALKLAGTTLNKVYLASVDGQPSGEPTTQEISIAGGKIRDGRAVIRHLGNARFEIVAEQIVDAEVVRNGSVARSLRAVNVGGQWRVEE